MSNETERLAATFGRMAEALAPLLATFMPHGGAPALRVTVRSPDGRRASLVRGVERVADEDEHAEADGGDNGGDGT